MTHVGPEDTVSLANYHTYQFNRPKVSKAQKYSGGIAILVKNDIKNAVSLVSSGLFSIWLKLDKNFFHFDNDIFVCVTYLPPDNSTYSNHCDINCMDLLEEQIQLHSRSGNICIIGDLNARTAENLDYVHND